ncbi:hypothetical protein DFQ00_102329 [Paenibacillus barcinonensis]|uniref:Uncharacterized protein n=1 Tax=Paenibacillus barcinonensis TaxID=198119 RepID=A0A2V4W090_PAEBA|nr:hypothetical protein DFQ00_102329 [Paenibacillus barcinonensis]
MIVQISRLPTYMVTYFQKHSGSPEVNVRWNNYCDEEGKDCCKISVDSIDGNVNYYYDEVWGNFKNIEEVLEELK